MNIKAVIFDPERCLLDGHYALNAIVNNPYRILGVYANATLKEITASASKIKKYIEVGKFISFPSDLSGILPPINRTKEVVDDALVALSNNQNKLAFAQFWFVNTDEKENICLTKLANADKENAIQIFEKINSWSAKHNLIVIKLIDRKYEEAVKILSSITYQDNNLSNIISLLKLSTIEMDSVQVQKTMIDKLLVDMEIHQCRELFKEYGETSLGFDYISEILSTRLSKTLNQALTTSQNLPNHNCHTYLRAAKQLKKETTKPLNELGDIIGTDNGEVILLSDNIANQIVQFANDYYRLTYEQFAVFSVLDLAEYALSIAKGYQTKERCRSELERFEKIADKIPPLEVAEYDIELKTLILKYSNGNKLSLDEIWETLEEFVPYIVQIKECSIQSQNNVRLRVRIDRYLKEISTEVVNLVLNKLIENVNDSKWESYTLMYAWNITLNLEKFPMNDDFKETRFDKNKTSLKNIIEKQAWISLTVSLKPSRTLDFRTEYEVWESCETIDICNYYLKRYPKGKYVEDIKRRRDKLELEKEEQIWHRAKIMNNYAEYISLYPNGRYINQAVEAVRIIKEKQDEAAFRACKTKKDYVRYITRFANGKHTDAAEAKIKEFDDIENTAWTKCKTKADYAEYLENYPDGQYIEEAKKKLESIRKQRVFLCWFIVFQLLVLLGVVVYFTCTIDTFIISMFFIVMIFFFSVIITYSLTH